MAGVRHGTYELTRYGIAGNGMGTSCARHGMYELVLRQTDAIQAYVKWHFTIDIRFFLFNPIHEHEF
jgi:hypothetical protein